MMNATSQPKPLLFRMMVLAITLILITLILSNYGSTFALSPYMANIVGQIATFALLALALDLIWGYAGILSLGHGLFFAIGGYLCAMHLLKAGSVFGGMTPDILVFMGWDDFPVHWAGLESTPYAILLILFLPAVVALVYGLMTFNSRISGVYFAIITQALTYIAMLLMFRNDTGFGGNNGMTGFTQILGQPIGTAETIRWMAIVSVAMLLMALLACKLLTNSVFGRILIAVRDDEPRLRFLGYDTRTPKVVVWCLSAVIASIAGALYVPQVGIVNPRILSPELSIEIAVWVALGGRGSLSGAVLGAALISSLKFWLTGMAPELWPFILAAVVLLVVTTLPNGLSDMAIRFRLSKGAETRAQRPESPLDKTSLPQ